MKRSAFPFLLLFFLLTLGVVIASQKQQEIRTRASANSTLSLVPSTSFSTPITKRVGDTLTFDVMLYPRSNQISTVKVHIILYLKYLKKLALLPIRKLFLLRLKGRSLIMTAVQLLQLILLEWIQIRQLKLQ